MEEKTLGRMTRSEKSSVEVDELKKKKTDGRSSPAKNGKLLVIDHIPKAKEFCFIYNADSTNVSIIQIYLVSPPFVNHLPRLALKLRSRSLALDVNHADYPLSAPSPLS